MTLAGFAIPRRPHFAIQWMRVGCIEAGAAVPATPLLAEAKGVYLIMREGAPGRLSPQYLGMTFGQTLAQRIGQHLRGLERVGAAFAERRHLFAGFVHPLKYRQLSRKMVSEIEEFLIWALHPPGNKAQLTPYAGREMLIENTGHEFGMPRFLYVNSLGPIVVVAQGPSPERMTQKVLPRIPRGAQGGL